MLYLLPYPNLRYTPPMTDDYLSASDLADYTYCHRAWWLRRRGAPSANQPQMDTGTRQHAQLAEAVATTARHTRLAKTLLMISLALLMLAVFFLLTQPPA